MAELLVIARDNVSDDPRKDIMLYKRGMPVVVMPDGHEWGRMECPPDFVVIKLPGVSVEAASQYIAHQYREEDYQPQSARLVVSKTPPYRRRDWIFTLDSLPPRVLQALNERGEVVIDASGDIVWEQAKDCLYSNRLERTEQRSDVRIVDTVI